MIDEYMDVNEITSINRTLWEYLNDVKKADDI